MRLFNYIWENKVRLIIISLYVMIALSKGFSQVSTGWLRSFNSPPNLVDYGRKIELDNSGDVFVSGHSFVNGGQEGVTTIIKYSADGEQQWAEFTEAGVNMEDFKVGNDGNLYVTGDKWNGSDFDILLIKYDNNGTEIWRKFFDGGHWDRSFAIGVDNSGNIYQTGITWYQPQFYNFVTIKYNGQGDTLWTRTFSSEGQESDYPKKVIIDHSGNIYVAGFAARDIAIVKYTPQGRQIWVRKIDMNFNYDELFSPHIAIDNNDNLIVCGNKYNLTSRSDILVSKYDSSGTQSWIRFWNGSNNDSDVVSGDAIGDEALALDGTGNIYVTGTTVNPFILFSDNVVTLKYNSNGNLGWSHIYDGPANDWDRPYSIKVSNSGNVYVSGETVEVVNSLVPLDYLTFKLNTNGELQWKQTFNGVGNFYDKAVAMTINDREEVFVTGISSQDQQIFGGNRDIVTIKYTQSTTNIISNNIVLDYKLSQNYPNPFNPITKISYNIPQQEFVSLKVFDITGKDVAVLVNEIKNSGEHSLNFNASNLTSGTYFYSLEAGDFKMTKRMMLVK